MKKYILSLIPFLGAVICGISYNLMGGCRVAEDGVLVEPFFLIPIGWLCVLIGIIWMAINIAITLIKKFKSKKTKNS